NGLTRINNGTFLFRGASTMGTAAATTAIPNIVVNGLGGSLVGGGGPGGGTQVSIIPFAIGDTTAVGTGTTFVTYDTSVNNFGVRPLLVATEYIQQTTPGIPAS